jgi:hypothetical protein
MQAFTNFILTVALPPNRSARSTTSATRRLETRARRSSTTRPSTAASSRASFCHRNPLGTDGLSTFEGEPQEFKIAHLREPLPEGRHVRVGGATR